MKQAITTKYLSPTNLTGSRIKATCQRGSITVAYDHGLNTIENHKAAVDALCNKFAAEDKKKYGDENSVWKKNYVMGALIKGWAAVFVD